MYQNMVLIFAFMAFQCLQISRTQSASKKPPAGTRYKMKGSRMTTANPIINSHNMSNTDIMEYLLKVKKYVKEVPPAESSGSPTEVKLGIYVNSFSSINEQTMEYVMEYCEVWSHDKTRKKPCIQSKWIKNTRTHSDYSINFYLRQQWTDHRLAFAHYTNRTKQFRIGMDHEKMKEDIWVPDTFFRNEKRASYHRVTVKNRLLKLSSDGRVWYVSKISAVLSCPMKLQTYPMDIQVCPMSFESFGYTMDTIYFAWLDSPVEVDPSVDLNQYERIDELLYDCSLNYTSGAYPCQEIQFRLRRTLGYFVIQIFVPSSLIVILSWLSFYINIDAYPARVSIGLLTVLTTVMQSSSANQSLPRVSYIKAIDIWMIMCLMFTFASLLEYSFVCVVSRNGVRVRTPVVRQAPFRPVDLNSGNAQFRREIRQESQWYGCWKSDRGPQLFMISVDVEGCKRRARKIDKISRKCFPFSFLLFNLIYWTAYTIMPTSASSES